jgi:YVTN family beta-propeller protein
MNAIRLTGLGLLVCALLIGWGLSAPAPTAEAQVGGTPTPLPLYALPDARSNRSYSSSTLALGDEGRLMAAANFLNNTVSLLIPPQTIAPQGRLLAEIPVGGDPRTVAITPDSTRVLVASRRDSTLTIIDVRSQTVSAVVALGGAWAYGVVSSANDTAYVSLQGSGEIVTVDLNAAEVRARLSVPAFPSGLMLWGDFLYITHFWTGDVSLIYLPLERLVTTAHLGSDLGVAQSIEPDISRGLAYLPATRANADNPALTYDTAVFPVVNVVNLRDLTPIRGQRIALDTADRPVNTPFAAALDRFAGRLYVANAGSDSVSVIDLNTGRARLHLETPGNPRGVLLNRDNSLLYVHAALDGTITAYATNDFRVVDVLPISNLTVSADVLIGAELFHSADSRLSVQGWVSCASCHFDGMSDGRTWRGFPDGPRNTPTLYALPETVPYNWSGTWDELADVELKIRMLMAGDGLIEEPPPEALDPLTPYAHGGLSADLDILAAYLSSLTAPRNPQPLDSAQIERGRALFEAENCAACHVGTVGTDLRPYDVGTGLSGLERRGTSFDTPSLRWLWLSAPYFHDGAARRLADVFTLPGTHQLAGRLPPSDIDALASYLLSLPNP